MISPPSAMALSRLVLPLALASCAALPSASPGSAEGSGTVGRSAAFVRVHGGAVLVQDEEAQVDYSDVAEILDLDAEVGVAYGAAVGYRFDDRWSIDLKVARESSDIDSDDGVAGDIDATTILLGVSYRLPVEWRVRPYVGLSAGIAQEVELQAARGGASASTFDLDGDAPAFALRLGADARLTDRLIGSVELRLLRAPDVDLSGPSGNLRDPGESEIDYASDSILFGLAYLF